MLGAVINSSLLMNTARMSDMPFRGQMVNEAITGLANGAQPVDGLPWNAVGLQRMEKALMFQGIQAQTNYLVSQARLDGLAKMRESQTKQDERLRAAGALFV